MQPYVMQTNLSRSVTESDQGNTVNVYQLILIFLRTKIMCHMTTAAVHKQKI